jgi:hypothetical protein
VQRGIAGVLNEKRTYISFWHSMSVCLFIGYTRLGGCSMVVITLSRSSGQKAILPRAEVAYGGERGYCQRRLLGSET